jgi:hypothetical protein
MMVKKLVPKSVRVNLVIHDSENTCDREEKSTNCDKLLTSIYGGTKK